MTALIWPHLTEAHGSVTREKRLSLTRGRASEVDTDALTWGVCCGAMHGTLRDQRIACQSQCRKHIVNAAPCDGQAKEKPIEQPSGVCVHGRKPEFSPEFGPLRSATDPLLSQLLSQRLRTRHITTTGMPLAESQDPMRVGVEQ